MAEAFTTRFHASVRAAKTLLALAALLGAATSAPALAAPKALIFPFELIDTSEEGALGGVRADETRRLALLTDEFRRLVTESGRYELADPGPLAAEIAEKAPLHRCNGCEADIAAKAGADLAITGTVQKVSNLILNINIYVRRVGDGAPLRAMSADIRSNTDESWLRGIRYLVKNRFLDESAR